MKGITMCADCAYYNMKTHKCTRGCTGEPDIENGDDVRFFTDCPLPNVAEVRSGRWIECDYKTLENGEIESTYKAGLCCSECRTGFKKNRMTYKAFCPACGAQMDDCTV